MYCTHMGKEDIVRPSHLVPSDNLVKYLNGLIIEWEKSDKPPEFTEECKGNHIKALHKCNYLLWGFEDDIRNPDITDTEIVDLKNKIDQTNKKRAQEIENIDHDVDNLIQCQIFLKEFDFEGYELNSQSVGQIIDRLSILLLKKYYITQCGSDASLNDGNKNQKYSRAEVISLQIKYIIECLQRFLQKLSTGKAKMLPYKQMKFYKYDG